VNAGIIALKRIPAAIIKTSIRTSFMHDCRIKGATMIAIVDSMEISE
jgi:hypothetical protein